MVKKLEVSDNSENESECSENTYDIDGAEDNDDNTKHDINPVDFFSVKELCYYKMIDKYFQACQAENIDKMINIIEGNSSISLRVLDWFVTKYSKKRIESTQNNGEAFDVRISYKSQLKSYKKRYFDPFRRRRKFNYYFESDKKKCIVTTLGQLNFFKWAFTNNILVYVEKNLKQIGKEMNLANKEDKKKKKQKNDEVVKKKVEEKISNKVNEKTRKSSDTSSNSSSNDAIKKNENGEVQIVLSFD